MRFIYVIAFLHSSTRDAWPKLTFHTAGIQMPAFNLPMAASYVVIAAMVGMIWSIMFWHIRLFIRLKINGPFGWDDIHCTIATVFGIINSCITITETHYGLGQSIRKVPPSDAYHLQLLSWVASLLYILALCFAMLSVCCLIIRIIQHTQHVWLARGIAIVTAMWTVISFFLLAFMCEPPRPWITRPLSRCIDIVSLGHVYSAPQLTRIGSTMHGWVLRLSTPFLALQI